MIKRPNWPQVICCSSDYMQYLLHEGVTYVHFEGFTLSK